jgi:hypothetical protein
VLVVRTSRVSPSRTETTAPVKSGPICGTDLSIQLTWLLLAVRAWVDRSPQPEVRSWEKDLCCPIR